MAKLKHIFKRKEKKYPISLKQYNKLRTLMTEHTEEDQYGLHTINSLYYDTDDYQLIQKSIDKPKYKEKFRVRVYGEANAESMSFLEIKKKFKGVVYKRRLSLPYNHVDQFLTARDEETFEKPVEKQIASEIDWLFTRLPLKPKVLVAYDRIAMFGKEDPDFRITFDFNIRYRLDELDLRNGSYGARVAPEMDVLMEVKALGSYPIWFAEFLSELEIYPSSFSKFAQVYTRHILSTEEKVIKMVEVPTNDGEELKIQYVS